ncbi:MAG TPA: YceI family protein [Candidatus Limnocylindrales bacterium]|nr:YceI family protein [Candidatus Limnocylindrales bacterium]
MTSPATQIATRPSAGADPARPIASTWTVDPSHTDILFSAKHMMVTTVRGTFRDVEGTLVLDEDEPARSSAEIRIATASVDTASDPRDAHLRSADFFDAERRPWIEFRSTAIDHLGGREYRITGDLTILETTRPVVFDATFLGFYTGMSGARRMGLSANATINRKDWGLGWNVALEAGGWLVGEDVRIDVEVAAEQATAAVDVGAGQAETKANAA